MDSIFYNENVGPFIWRQLIQRLVTSNPSRDYLYRVVEAFRDNGKGVRGDMKAVITAILMDYEARSATLLEEPTFGKQREPVLRALGHQVNLSGQSSGLSAIIRSWPNWTGGADPRREGAVMGDNG